MQNFVERGRIDGIEKLLEFLLLSRGTWRRMVVVHGSRDEAEGEEGEEEESEDAVLEGRHSAGLLAVVSFGYSQVLLAERG